MRKKHKVFQYQSPGVRIEPLPKAYLTSVASSNLQKQKDLFLKHGKTPIFVVEGDTSTVEELATKISGNIRFDLLGEAEYIVNTVKQKYGMGENYLDQIYGPWIDQSEANNILFNYIGENSLQESMAVYWSNEITCSARMVWKGYSFKCNRPEMRRYALWLNGTHENPYLRRDGLQCLLDHEIGTHFFRCYNDGFQPWFYDRKKFGLRGTRSFENLCTEEGLAAINTTLRAKKNYLWLSALTYYTVCKSTEMNFKQLFDHLGLFIDNPDQRWKHVMRIKRGLVDPNDLGGYGRDQCYFEGAVSILRNIDNINFNLLMSGKICYDEVSRIKRMARMGSVRLPAIMQDMEKYRHQLKNMAIFNGLYLEHPSYQPPRAYLQRLEERQAGIKHKRKVRKGKKKVCSFPSFKVSGFNTDESGVSSEEYEESLVDMNAPPANLGGPYRCLDDNAFMAGEGTSQEVFPFGPDTPSGSGSISKFQAGKGKAVKAKTTQIPVAGSKEKERPNTVAVMAVGHSRLPPVATAPSGQLVKSKLPIRAHHVQPESGDVAGPFTASCPMDDDDDDDNDDDDFYILCDDNPDLLLHNLPTPISSICSIPAPCLTFSVDVPFESSPAVLPPIGQENKRVNASPDQARCSSADKSRNSSSDKARSSSSDKARGSSSDKARGSSSDKARGSSSDKAKGFSSDKARGSSSDKAKGFSSDKARGSSSDKAKGFSSDKARGSSSDKARGSTTEMPRHSSADKSFECSPAVLPSVGQENKHGNASPNKARCSSADKSRSSLSDKARGSSSDKVRGSSSDKARGSSSDKTRGSSSDKARGSSSDKARGSSAQKSRNSSADKSVISSADKFRISSADKSRISSADKSRSSSANKSRISFKSRISSDSGTSSAARPRTKAEQKSQPMHGSHRTRPSS